MWILWSGGTPRSIARYGFAGFRDTSLGRVYGLWWLAAAGAAVLVPELVSAGSLRAVFWIAIAVLITHVFRLPVSFGPLVRRIQAEPDNVSGEERAQALAKATALGALIATGAWLAITADGVGELSALESFARWVARGGVMLWILAWSSWIRQERIAEIMSETDVWNMEDDTSYHSRRMVARGIDSVIVAIGAVAVMTTGWWEHAAPDIGITGTREFVTGMTVLCGYELLCGYAGCSIGKLLCGLRTRRAPGVGKGRAAVAPLVRVGVLVVAPGVWILWWANVVSWTDSTTLEQLAGLVVALLLFSVHFHGEAQGVHDAAAGSVVVRRRRGQRCGTFFSAWP